MMLGYAWQRADSAGPRIADARHRAQRGGWNRTRRPSRWGRRARARLGGGAGAARPGLAGDRVRKRETLDALVARRVEFLTDYQNAAYAGDSTAFVRRSGDAELRRGKTALTEAVARYRSLMAYKDEYEVARACTATGLPRARSPRSSRATTNSTSTRRRRCWRRPTARASSSSRNTVRVDADGLRPAGEAQGLRGTARWISSAAPRERRTERALIVENRAGIDELLARLSADTLPLALGIKRASGRDPRLRPKAAHLAAARTKWNRAGRPLARRHAAARASERPGRLSAAASQAPARPSSSRWPLRRCAEHADRAADEVNETHCACTGVARGGAVVDAVADGEVRFREEAQREGGAPRR